MEEPDSNLHHCIAPTSGTFASQQIGHTFLDEYSATHHDAVYQYPSLNSFLPYKYILPCFEFLLVFFLFPILLSPVDSFIWPFSSIDQNTSRKPVAGRDAFEYGLTRNVGRMSDESLFGSASLLHWFGFRYENQSKTSHSSKHLEIGEIYPFNEMSTWKLNDINSLNISGEFGSLLGFGDYNSDKHVDMFFVTSNPTPESDEGPLSISILLWDPLIRQFVLSPLVPLPQIVTEVSGLIPIDVNFDGLLDVIVTFPIGSSFDFLVMLQNPTSRRLTFSKSRIQHSQFDGIDVKSIVHFSIMDINFDGYPDIVGQIDPSRTPSKFSLSGGRIVWINHFYETISDFLPSFLGFGETQQFMLHSSDRNLPPLSSPHSSAYLDINGDCVPDLVFDVVSSTHQRYLEIWLSHTTTNGEKVLKTDEDYAEKRNSKDSLSITSSKPSVLSIVSRSLFSSPLTDGSYSPKIENAKPVYVLSNKHQLYLPEGVQQISFSDSTADGTIDVIASACLMDSKGSCINEDRIIVFKNRQFPLCPDLGFKNSFGLCRQSSTLCQSVDFTWDSSPNTSPLNPFDEKTGSRNFVGTIRYPITLRVGDFDSDGYPDVLSLVKGPSGRSEIMLFRNVHGDPKPIQGKPRFSLFSIFQIFDFNRNSNKNETKDEKADVPMFIPHSLLAVPDVSFEAATFFDLGEDGRLDVIAATEADQGWLDKIVGSKPPKLISFIHGEDNSLFIKSTGLSGSCATGCYGSLSHGATFKLTGSDLSGSRFSRVASQLSQSGYSPLQLPYSLFGLGKINNYIEFFFYGIAYSRPMERKAPDETSSNRKLLSQQPRDILINTNDMNHQFRDTGNFHRWISLIPNSFVIANPYTTDNSSKWKLELSVSPSKYFWRILGASLISLVIIGIVICLLDRREKAEDLKELQGFRRHFIAVG